MELLCFGIAPIILTKPFWKEHCCLDSSILFGKVLWGWLSQFRNKEIPQPPPWLNLRRKPELDLLPLELDFLYGSAPPSMRSLAISFSKCRKKWSASNWETHLRLVGLPKFHGVDAVLFLSAGNSKFRSAGHSWNPGKTQGWKTLGWKTLPADLYILCGFQTAR